MSDESRAVILQFPSVPALTSEQLADASRGFGLAVSLVTHLLEYPLYMSLIMLQVWQAHGLMLEHDVIATQNLLKRISTYG